MGAASRMFFCEIMVQMLTSSSGSIGSATSNVSPPYRLIDSDPDRHAYHPSNQNSSEEA